VSLDRGTKLGPYEIVEPIGAGGMGEVYKARDTRLDRIVAIKISAAQFTERFEREARAVAALNHPHICTLHDVGPDYLVMEFVEGPTLGERIAAGPIPVDEALAIARQIAEALEAAHEKGIVHRDLKPANVKFTAGGQVKVLDFGLAKALDTEPAADPRSSPTLTLSGTRAGVVLGTAAYMSPEQARGTTADKRADIWSFGVVLYEMLTGRHLFRGETVSDTLAGVLKTDPDWKALSPDTPASIRRLLRRCLERDRKRRLRDIGDALIEIDWPAEALPPASPRPGIRPRIAWAAAGLSALLAIVVTWGWLRNPTAPPRTVTRWEMTFASLIFSPSLSRDGTRLAYSEFSEGSPRLMLRMMDQLEGTSIPGADFAGNKAFSPDGQWIAYMTGFPVQLKKTPLTGGTQITLCDVPTRGQSLSASLTWGDDDTIVFGSSKGLMRVLAAGGRPQSLTEINPRNGEIAHGDPQFLPGGQTILFTLAESSPNSSRIAVLDLKTHTYRVVANPGWAGRYVPTGHLVYRRGSTLFAVPFDVRRLAVTGSENPVVEGIGSLSGPGTADYTFSDSGLLVAQAGRSVMQTTTLAWMDRKGGVQLLSEPPHGWITFRMAPDGKRMAAQILSSTSSAPDIWIYDFERGTLTRLSSGGSGFFAWTPDSRWVTFGSFGGGKYGIYRVPADSSGQPELLLASESAMHPFSWTPDGKTLLYTQFEQGVLHIYVLPFSGNGGESKPRRLFAARSFEERSPELSPDGKWLAYFSSESGKNEVYVVPFPGPGARTTISTRGGMIPRWSHTGRELFYEEPGPPRRLMAVEIQTGPPFRAGHPEPLFNLTGAAVNLRDWDVAADSRRFLVMRPPEAAMKTVSALLVVTDWFEDLVRRVPVKR
jgi:serine/threonine-protein kinase